eukprot:m.202116 g.202116  ORF g.202116 m.202116 type:complete len:406 (+) comp39604_c0_seq41:38-1255(+)
MDNISIVKEKASEFLADANKSTYLKLVKTEADVLNDAKAFHPDMTHQIFGDSEMIFGYTQPRIDIYFGAATLNTYLNFSYTTKLASTDAFLEGVKPDSVLPNVAEKLTGGFCSNQDDFMSSLSAEASFTPFGRQVNVYQFGNTQYEVYQGDIMTPRLRQYHEKLQVFLLWFVDAASFIDVDDEKWRFFFLFEKDTVDGRPFYSIAGYATVYHYYAYPDKIRPRISQFLVLPPFQRKSHGAHLLQTIYDNYAQDSNVRDITVEDQSEEFTCLRDFVDCRNCLRLKPFSGEALQAGFTSEMASEASSELKLAKSQARRVYEILRLRATDRGNAKTYRKYRLAVKSRLNKPFQRKQEELKKLERVLNPSEMVTAVAGTGLDERHQQLAAMYQSLEESYLAVVEKLASL